MTSTRGTCGNEYTGVLASEGALGPETTSGIPEGLLRRTAEIHTLYAGTGTHLPLSGEVTVTRGDAKEEAVEFRKLLGADNRVVGLSGSVELGEDLIVKSFRNPEGIIEKLGGITDICNVLIDGCFTTGLSDTLLGSLSNWEAGKTLITCTLDMVRTRTYAEQCDRRGCR